MTDQPFVLMIAGPNGSGKSTLTRELQARGIDLGDYINPDDIAATLPGSYAEQVRAAQAEADRRRAACLEDRRSFSFETVMSHGSKVDVLREAQARGFRTLLYFVATSDPEINVARVAQRVKLGGHAVPEDRIIARYHRALSLLPQAMQRSDRTVLFDNSDRLADGGPVLLRPVLSCGSAEGEPRFADPSVAWAATAFTAYQALQPTERDP